METFSSLHKFIDLVDNSPSREHKMSALTSLYEHIARHMDEVANHPKLYDAARKKLLEFVVVDDWHDGRRFFPNFKINSIQEAFFTIGTLTGLSQTGFISKSGSRSIAPDPVTL